MENNSPRIGFVRKMARQILKEAGVTGSPVILNDIVKYIRSKYSIDVMGANLPEDLDGITVSRNGENSIGYNQNKHPHRNRFTVAHEIGHVVLGHVGQDKDLSVEQKRVNEKEADEFAAELLMPKDFIKKDMENRINGKLLAERYWVSEQALWIRLMALKLV